MYIGNTDLPKKQIGPPPSDPQLQYVTIDADTVSRQIPWQAVDSAELPTAQGLKPASQTAPHYVYRVGPGDILSIVVWNHPELTNPYGTTGGNLTQSGSEVRANGSVFFPFAGVLHVAGLTVEQIRHLITKHIKAYIANPQVGVRVLAYRAHKVYVTGYVNKPGIQYLTNQPLTVMDAINDAGGLQQASRQQKYGANHRVAILTRDGKKYLIDLHALYSQGASTSNVLLKSGDTLYVPDDWSNQVFVLGAVNKPQALTMNQGRMTLAEALSAAGGPDPEAANGERIFVIRGLRRYGEQAPTKPSHIVPVVYHLNASSADALLLADEFQLHPHDVVYVSTKGSVRYNRVIHQILPTVSTIFQTHALIRNW